jgi:hypothetical protein
MSDTPETDAVLKQFEHHLPNWLASEIMAEVARRLERERDDLRAIFPKILEALESGACAATCSVDFLREIPREVKLVRQRLERERDEWKQVAEGSLLGAIKERDEAVRSCQIWQQGHSKIVEDRDYWRAEAERWREVEK